MALAGIQLFQAFADKMKATRLLAEAFRAYALGGRA